MKLTKIFALIGLLSINYLAIAQSGQILKVNQKEGCVPLEVSFQIEQDSVQSYFWNFGNGSVSVLPNPTVLYRHTGEYDITLILKYHNHTTDTVFLKNYIKVIDQSVADFELDQDTLCFQKEITFLNKSVNASSFLWDFGDGSSSTDINPKHTYQSAGEYTVSLVAYNEYGCGVAQVKEKMIKIEPLVFDGDKNIICENESVHFKAEENFTEYLWDFGDGTKSEQEQPVYTYHKSGNYDVSLTVTTEKGCKLTETIPQLVQVMSIPDVKIDLSDSLICLGDQLDFSAVVDPTESITWKLDQEIISTESKFSTTFEQEGTFALEVTLQSASGCVAVNNYPNAINVVKAAAPVFEASDFEGCAPLNLSIKNITEDAISTSWYIDDKVLIAEELNYSLKNQGLYTIKAQMFHKNGCVTDYEFEQKALVHNTINEIETLDRQGCLPFATEFTLRDKNVDSVVWDFGNGHQGKEVTSQAIYELSGLYQVSVKFKDQYGCDKSLELNSPVEVFDTTLNYTSPAVITTCSYSDVSFYGGMGNDFWQWDFGDGLTSTEKNPVHVFDKQGIYKVSLRTNNDKGCATTIPLYNEIHYTGLNAEIDYSIIRQEACEYFEVKFDTKLEPSQDILWKFDDDSTSTEESLTKIFSDVGKRKVTAKITDNNGCSISKVIVIDAGWSGCGPLMEDDEEKEEKEKSNQSNQNIQTVNSCSVPFEVSLNNPLQNTTQIQWIFGDGNISTEPNTTHTYTKPGTYQIKYNALLDDGNRIENEEYITVNIFDPSIDFRYSFNATCNGIEVNFSSITDQLLEWNWNFSDGSRLQELKVNKNYTRDQIDQVIFTATDLNGCKVSAIKNIEIGNPHAKFVYDDNICLGESFDIQHNIRGFQDYNWILGDGNTDKSYEPNHTYQASGKYQVVLETADQSGCIKSYQLPRLVSVINPVADFSVHGSGHGCNNHQVEFRNQSEASEQWYWDFGNGKTSQARDPKISFSPGIYSVSLTAENQGCKNTKVWQELIKVDELISDFVINQESTCLPSVVVFEDKSKNASAWLWEFGDGQMSNEQNPQHKFQQFPGQKVKLTVTNEWGCKVSKSQELKFFQPSFAVDNSKGCFPLNVNFKSNTEQAGQWFWDFGDGSTSELQNPQHTYLKSGIYDVSLKAVSLSGCESNVVKKSIIEVGNIKASFTSKRDESICAPLLVSFHNQSTGATTFHWDFGDAATSNLPNPIHIFSKVGQFSPKLIVSNKLGCRDSIVLENHVVTRGPQAGFTLSDSAVCAPAEIQFTDLSVSAKSLRWIFGDGSTSEEVNPKHDFITPGIYSVSLSAKDEMGCSETVTFDSIRVYPKPEAKFDLIVLGQCMPVDLKIINQSSKLADASFTWDFGTKDYSYKPEPSYRYSKPGSYMVNLKVTNGATCTDMFTFPKQIIVRDTVNTKEPEVLQLSVINDSALELKIKPHEKNNLRYQVLYRKADQGLNFEIFDTIPQAINDYVDVQVFPYQQSYQYKIQSHTFCHPPTRLTHLNYYQSIHLSLQNVDNKVYLKWNHYHGHDFSHYSVERKEEYGDWLEIAKIKPYLDEFSDKDELCPGKYYYRVSASKLAGRNFHSQSNTANTAITTDYTQQNVQIVRTTVIGHNQVLTEWKEPEFGVDNVKSYEIWRSAENESYSLLDSVPGGITSYVDTQVSTEIQNYTYKVQVINTCQVATRESNTGNSILLQKTTRGYKNHLYWNTYHGWKEGVSHFLLQKLNQNGEWITQEILDESIQKAEIDLE